MPEAAFEDDVRSSLGDIRSLVARAVELQNAENDLGHEVQDLQRQRTAAIEGLLDHASSTAASNRIATELATERTSLTREQTRLSTRSTELGNIRTELSRERSALAGQRTDLSVLRTDMARARTNLADQRTGMARTRTFLSERRTHLADSRTSLASQRTNLATRRTSMSKLRTELARGRTYLALTRTGIAFLTLGVGLMRFFGLSWWSLFDIALIAGSVVATGVGLRGYLKATRLTRVLDNLLAAE